MPFTLFRRKKDCSLVLLDKRVADSLSILRNLAYHNGLLEKAIAAAISEDDGLMEAYCEDYGIDQVDPIKRIDVLKHALKLVRETSSG